MTNQRYSHSMLSDFKACPLRYYLRHVEGLQLRDAASNSHHLIWGTAFHLGLEWFYSALRDTGSYNGEQCVKYGQGAFASMYPIQLDPTDKVKTQENGVRALQLYVNRWAEEDRKWRVLEVEGPGQLVEATNIGIGELHTDLIVENLEHGGIYVIDHKTTGKQLGPWYWDQFNPNSQVTYYIDYAEQRFGSCEGFIINAISLQWRDEFKKDGANNVAWFNPDDPEKPWLAYSNYKQRDYRGGPLGKKGPRMCAWGLTVNFERQVFNRTREQIKQERESTAYWIRSVEHNETTCRCGHQKNDHSTHPDLLDICSACFCECPSFEPRYAFNTSSCYSCEYRGGEMQGGICRPGYAWPQDREIISLSYRQVCRQVIKLSCPACTGLGVDDTWRTTLAKEIISGLTFTPATVMEGVLELTIQYCARCTGSGKVDGPRCQLDRGHAGTCAIEMPPEIEDEILVEVSV